MEGEDRRGREARENSEWLALDHRKAERLARLERNPMHDHTGRAEPRDHAMREIAGALGGTTRDERHVAHLQRGAQRELERDLVVRKGAEWNRLAARFFDRRRHDRAVAVIDRGGP